MTYMFSLNDIFMSKLIAIKPEVYDNLLYHKVNFLLEIWFTQKKLVHLLYDFNKLEESNFRQDNIVDTKPQENSEPYKNQYIKFLIQNDLIFLDEVSDENIVLNLIYYWLMSDIKRDKDILNNY